MQGKYRIKRNFVPHALDTTDIDALKPLYEKLIERPLNDDFRSADDLELWLNDFSEISSVLWEKQARLSIDQACHTDDEAIEKAYMHFVETVIPPLEPIFFELQKKFLECPFIGGVPFEGIGMLERDWKADVDIFNEANIPLFTSDTKLKTKYGKIAGAMTVEYDGKTQTLQQLALYQEETDRSVREETYKLSWDRRLEDSEDINVLFDEQLMLREQIATNAGFDNYRDYMWKVKKRFDYTPEDCLQYADTVADVVMPAVKKIVEARKEAMSLDALRPWDSGVDPKGRAPLRPFDPENIDGFVDGVKKIFNKIDYRLADQFEDLRRNKNLDLATRKGKRPGGFQSSLEETREPFIFMNAAGTQRDVDTLLHEGGHAFHYQAARHLPLVFSRHAPLEFCEVASMSMELLGCDHYNFLYNDEENASRAKRHQLEGALSILPWVATIDSFQHWLYTHKGHSVEERTSAWTDILEKFKNDVTDWSGLEHHRDNMWQRQPHLFSVPFYYIEYGIAQLGALQVWLNYKQDPQLALTQLLDAFKLGNTVTLPELFNAAGINFDFSEKTIKPIVEAVLAEVQKLPE